MSENETTTAEETAVTTLARFEVPSRLEKIEDPNDANHLTFVAEPFENGYGHTLGNSLRRVLLGSLEGAAITSVRIAGAQHASSVVVTPSTDDTAVLCTLSVRELNPKAKVVASVRESENRHLLLQSGADSVVTSAETAGRLLGLATVTPTVVEMMEDLLSPNEGFSVAERAVREFEVGSNPRHLADIVLAVLRNNELHRVDTADAYALKPGDRLLYIKHEMQQAAEDSDEDEDEGN